MNVSNEPSDGESQPHALSAETVLAVRRYNQQVASYTLRQWNLAKLESERKERDRRKRRADHLRQQAASAHPPAARPPGSLVGAGCHGLRPFSEGSNSNPDGPLMMVSRRRTERALSGGSSVASLGPAQPITRPSHDKRYTARADQPVPRSDNHTDIAPDEDHPLRHQQQQRPRRHHRSSHGLFAAELTALHPTSPIPAASTAIDSFGKPDTKHVESPMTGIVSCASSNLDNRSSIPPQAWQRRVSGSTSPITIPKPSVATESTASGSTSSSWSSVPRSASPARALGFAAHLGMTTISTGPSLADSMSTSTSTSNATSEGSSRMSSFSDNNGMSGIKHSMKRVTEEDLGGSVRPKHPRRTSTDATMVQQSGPCAVEGAIGTLRRMTVCGNETGVYGIPRHHEPQRRVTYEKETNRPHAEVNWAGY